MVAFTSRSPLNFSNMRYEGSSLMNRPSRFGATDTTNNPSRFGATDTTNNPSRFGATDNSGRFPGLSNGAPPITRRIQPLTNPYQSQIDANNKKLSELQSQLQQMRSAPAPVPRSVEPDYLSMSNLAFDKIKDFLGNVDKGQGYAFRNGKWQKINVGDIKEPDFKYGYSYKGNDLLKGRQTLDNFYKKYKDSIDKAKEAAKKIINEDKANALLRGVKYDGGGDADIDKLARKKFNSIFGKENQSQLDSLIEEFGKPTNFSGLDYRATEDKKEEVPENKGGLNRVRGATGSSDTSTINPVTSFRDLLGGRKSLLGD